MIFDTPAVCVLLQPLHWPRLHLLYWPQQAGCCGDAEPPDATLQPRKERLRATARESLVGDSNWALFVMPSEGW